MVLGESYFFGGGGGGVLVGASGKLEILKLEILI